MLKKYRLHHRKHTGKLLHHRHTHYPALLLLVLIAGLLLFMTNRIAGAADILVNATVPAPIPTGAPAFTSPADGTTTDDASIDFKGTCPIITPAVIIALYDGTTLLGSGICDADGTFAVTASLTSGTHEVVATVVTITGDNGESSAPLHITYTPPLSPVNPVSPTPSAPSSGSTTGPIPEAGTIAPLDIITEKPFITFDASLQTDWNVHFTGGVAPYTVTIAWGDGHIDTRSVPNNDLQAFTHRFKSNRLYTVTVTLKDQSGLALTRYYVAMRVNGAPTAHSTTQNTLAGLLDSPIVDPFWAAWIIYLCLLTTMLLMWRYEHTHYPSRVIGVPLHYPWQKTHKHPLTPKH